MENLLHKVEAIIFAADKPLTVQDIFKILESTIPKDTDDDLSIDGIENSIAELEAKYNTNDFSFQIIKSGGGFQFLTKEEFFPVISEMYKDKFSKKLSRSSMETLSIIAYKQPITKGEIEILRGVNSDYSVQKLLEKELVRIAGRDEKLPGKPLVYETTEHFINYLGINSLSELPKIKELMPEYEQLQDLKNQLLDESPE